VGLALRDYTWTVLEDAGSSDHLPILTSLPIHLHIPSPTDLPIPIFDLSRHISWSVYADAILDSLATVVWEVDVGTRHDIFVDTVRSGPRCSNQTTGGAQDFTFTSVALVGYRV
jgi:hypothetical protein